MMKAKRILAALLAQCLMGANALAAGIFDDPDAMIDQYNRLIVDSAIRDALELRKYSDDGYYLNADEDIQISINEYGAVVYSLPSSGASNMPMVYLAAVIEANEPAASGFEDWANVAWEGDVFDCALFRAEFSITVTETTDDILCMRIEYKD